MEILNRVTLLISNYLISNLLFSKIFQKFLLEKHFAWEVDTKLGRVFHRDTPGKKSKLYSSKWRFLTFFYFWYVMKHVNFILGLNFIFLCFKLIIIHYYTPNKEKWNLNQRIKLSHNIHNYYLKHQLLTKRSCTRARLQC